MRRLFATMSALSFLICLTAAGLWVGSYWVSAAVRYPVLPPETLNRSRYTLSLYQGRVYWGVAQTTWGTTPPGSQGEPPLPPYQPKSRWTYSTGPVRGEAPYAVLRHARSHL